MALSSRLAGVNHLPARKRFPIRSVLEKVAHERLGGRVGLGAPGHIELAEECHSPALAVLHQRAVLKAVASIQDRQEIAAGGLLDQNGSHVAAVATAP